jgi:hypothetical protein
MGGNNFKRPETVVIDAQIDGIDSAISGVGIQIVDRGNSVVVPLTQMDNLGNQKFRYFFETASGYTGMSGVSSYSCFSGASGYTAWSGYGSGMSGYSSLIVGVFTVILTAGDLKNHIGLEDFNIRVE